MNGGAYRMEVNDGTHRVVFVLNDTPASRSLIRMLPFTAELSDYGSNEKIFDPPEPLSKDGGLERDCPEGSIAFFSPWGNIAMYCGDAPEYPGLYYMGFAEEGKDKIKELSGTAEFRLLRPQNRFGCGSPAKIISAQGQSAPWRSPGRSWKRTGAASASGSRRTTAPPNSAGPSAPGKNLLTENSAISTPSKRPYASDG